ncbi:hypothetical protein AAG906_007656 [Vitis piasezkii]
MNVDEAINVKPLSDDEALNMFEEKVGECISNFPKVTQVAQVVVKECGGLPLLIDKLAKAFKSFGEGYSAPNPEEWKQVYRISLMDNELHSLPEALDCCDLVTLLLQMNKNLVAIPEFFFTSMCHLRVLDLHGTGITSLPSSLCNLIGLRVLYLNSCIHLVGLPTDIEALKQLEVHYECLCLILAGKPNSEPIRKCFKLCFLGRFFVNSNLAWKDFFVRTSPAWEDLFHIPICTCKTHAFGLINHKGVSRLSDFGIENMNDLFICSIEGCNEIETIINGTGITKSVFEYLHRLHIKNVLKLESIWQGPVHAESLTLLRTLVLLRCPQLKKIFSNGMIQQLSKLEDLRVEELAILQRIEISMCHMLKRLPFNNANATKLRCIEGQQAWWEALEWMDDGA